MPFVQSFEDLAAWRDHVAREYANEPDTAAMLQLFASELDRGTWDLRITQAILMRKYNLSKAAVSRRWHKAMETGLVYDTQVVFNYSAESRNAEGHIFRLFKPPRPTSRH